ncbi:MAG: hypothetical protein JRJ49_10535 [Deltaproteobacteria bacterium]|nr:hypothetical protein [Deltaproteobacteria bacterium]
MDINYKRERTHDELLIKLARKLNEVKRLDIIENAFELEGLGDLKTAKRRQPFDVELTFSNKSVVIETKVDHDEGGRWEEIWQTEDIFKKASSLNYLNDDKVFLFLTYGTSEFYTKNYLTGPASKNFKHIKLSCIIKLVKSAIELIENSKEEGFEDWLLSMEIEREKRANASKLLKYFSIFRKNYLKIHKENDFPNNRFKFCAYELAFPVLSSLSARWDLCYAEKYGKLALYPMMRMSPSVPDSVLNFWEMWKTRKPPLGDKIFYDIKSELYLEINEDFNLNLKLDGHRAKDKIKNELWNRLNLVKWPDFVSAQKREYKQAVYVLYEFDFGFLDEVENINIVADNLARTVRKIIEALA